MVCIDCGGILARNECSPCLDCEIGRNKKREAAGRGERICRDCNTVFPAVDYDEDDNAIVHSECPECDSTDIEPLSKAQERAARRIEARS